MNIKEIAKFATTMAYITISDKETIHPDMDIKFVKKKSTEITWIED